MNRLTRMSRFVGSIYRAGWAPTLVDQVAVRETAIPCTRLLTDAWYTERPGRGDKTVEGRTDHMKGEKWERLLKGTPKQFFVVDFNINLNLNLNNRLQKMD